MDVREKLVELLDEAEEWANHECDELDCETCQAGKMRGNCFQQLMVGRLIDNGVTVQEWISVDDRLPESGAHVLICCEMHRYGGEIAGKYVCDGYYAEANKIIAGGFPDECDCEYSEEDDEYYLCEGWYEVIKNWDDYNSVAVEDFVTHWMPMPNPPKGE